MRSREAHHHVVPDLGRHEPLMDEKVSGKVFSDSDPREYTSVGLKKNVLEKAHLSSILGKLYKRDKAL